MIIKKEHVTLLVCMLINYYYIDNPVGGSLHLALDDGNLEDSHLHFCLKHARLEHDIEGEIIAECLLQMSMTQRIKVYKNRRG